jgi:hypothetical protein
MKIVQILATLSFLVCGRVAGVCTEYERNGPNCWVVNYPELVSEGIYKGGIICGYYDLRTCESFDGMWGRNCGGKCLPGDIGKCKYNSRNVDVFWCPGTCKCTSWGCDCVACKGCGWKNNAVLIGGAADIPDSEDDHEWYMGLSNKKKLAHLNEVVCQKHGYGNATSFELVKEMEDRADENHIDEHEKINNGGEDDGKLSQEEFKASYFDVSDLAKKYCSDPNDPNEGKPEKNGKSGKNAKEGKTAKRE